MRGSLNGVPKEIEAFKPIIRCGLIANLTPDPFLSVQPGLISRQISQTKSHMISYKQINFRTFMPSGPVYIEPDGIPSQTAIKMFQTRDKSLSIAPRPAHHPLATQQRSHPSKKIQSFAVLARGRNAQPPPSLCPPPAQSRVKRKARLVFKDDRFLRGQRPEFFLRPGEIAWPLHLSLEDRCTRPVSADIPIGASKTEPDELSMLFQTDASNEPLTWDHPTEFAASRIPTGASLNPLLIAAEPLRSIVADALVVLPAPKPLSLDRSLGAAKRLSSVASTPVRRRSIPDADLPASATAPRSLCPCGLPGFAVPGPANALWLHLDALTSRLGFS